MKRFSIAIIGMFLLFYIAPLGVRPMFIPDEFRYAEIPREMIVSGDWVVPHLDGLRYFEKPVLGYWLNAVSMIIFGQNAFAARFPSAAAVGISALLIFVAVRRFGGGSLTGMLASAVFLSFSEVYAIGTFSVLDSVLSMFVTASMVSFFFAYSEEIPPKKMGFLALFGAFCGLAFLTKGFIALAVPVVTIVPFMLWEGRWKELFRIAPVTLGTAVLVALPWALMIHFREPDFWNYFFWVEHIKRFMSENAQHRYPFWFFIPVLLGGALPWTAAAPAALSGLRKGVLKDSFIRFALCWFVFPFLFFSASKGKLGTYILPCFPPLAVLITTGLRAYFEKGEKRSFILGMSFLAGALFIATVILVVIQVAGFPGLSVYDRNETWKWIIVAIALLAWTASLVGAARIHGFKGKIALCCAGPLLFMFSGQFLLPDQVKVRKAPGDLLMRYSSRIHPDTVLVTNDLERPVCWSYRRSDVYILGSGGELDYGLNNDAGGQRQLTMDRFLKVIEDSRGRRSVTLIIDQGRYAEYKPLLPKPIFEDISGRFAFVQF